MKQADVRIGGTYAVKVSERIVPVRLEGTRPGFSGWVGVNLKTGRAIVIRSAQKLRFELVRAEGCKHWVRTDRDLAAHRAQYHGEEAAWARAEREHEGRVS